MYENRSPTGRLCVPRKSPTITISPTDYENHGPGRPWWKRVMSRRSRNMLFLLTLVSLGYFISGSTTGTQIRPYQQLQKGLPWRSSSVPHTSKLIESFPESSPPQALNDALASARELPAALEVHNQNNGAFPNATISMVTMLYGDANPVYERALQSHIDHGRRHGYSVHVLRQKLLGRLWSKPAYLLSIILDELQKPKETRLKWLFWFDADTVLINPKIPLELFLPPTPDFDHIHFLCGDDHNGLNDGAFLLRINDYSMHLMAAALTVESFRPEINLRFSEQSAIEHVVKSEDVVHPWDNFSYTDGYAKIPQRWMNAYMGPRTETGVVKARKKITGNSVKEGDMLVHFAGSGETKRRRMTVFMDKLKENRAAWELEIPATNYESEIAAFWSQWKIEETKRHDAIEAQLKGLEETEKRKLLASEKTNSSNDSPAILEASTDEDLATVGVGAGTETEKDGQHLSPPITSTKSEAASEKEQLNQSHSSESNTNTNTNAKSHKKHSNKDNTESTEQLPSPPPESKSESAPVKESAQELEKRKIHEGSSSSRNSMRSGVIRRDRNSNRKRLVKRHIGDTLRRR